MQKLKTVVVTGSNKGIGFGIVENLAQKPGWKIIMACRNLQLANTTKDQLKQRFPNAELHTEALDVTKDDSITNFIKVIAEKYKSIDVLINNAGVAAKGDAFSKEVVDFTFATNFFGTINFTESIAKYVADSGKIILVGSMIGKLTRISNEQLKDRFRNKDLTKDQLYALMNEFIQGVVDNNYAEKGWPKSIYGVSKIGINHYARVLSNTEDIKNRKIQVYSMCPGYVDTDMTSHKGVLTIQQGAQTPVFLAELPFQVNPKFQGQFFEKCSLSSLE